MKFNDVIKDLKSGDFKPVYLLTGDEPYFINKITDYVLEHAIAEEHKSFNQVVLYGQDVNTDQIIENAKRFPMMTEKQLVLIKEAKSVKNLHELVKYTNSPLSSTILVIDLHDGKVDKRSKNGKAFIESVKKNGVFFEAKKIYENQVPDWIQKYATSKGIQIDQKSSILLTEFLGNDLVKISNELDKLAILSTKDPIITPEIIERNIGISKDFNNFELQKAVLQRDVRKAFLIANYFKQNPRKNPLLVTVATLYGYFSKLLGIHLLTNKSKDNIISKLKIPPFFYNDYEMGKRNYSVKEVVQIIEYLQEYDLKSKGVNNISTEDGELLRELLCKIFEK
jgi:DNA polymerase-3 subunit delta